MSDEDVITETVSRRRKKPRWHVLISDFANIVKAFMGSNYLSIAYAFRQSGLVIGLLGLLLIASVTDHCCNLIVKCKYHVIQHLLDRHLAQSSSLTAKKSVALSKPFDKPEKETEENRKEINEISKHLTYSLTFGDIGRIACGNTGLFLVNACIIFTQFGFCIGYFIFIGNTLYSLFPYTETTIFSDGQKSTTVPPNSSVTVKDISNNTDSRQNSFKSLDYLGLQVFNSSFEVPDSVQIMYNSTDTPLVNSTTSSISEAPDLRLLVLSPLPVFIAFAVLRNIRHLGFVSIAANLSLLLGCVITLVYIVIGFELSSSWEMFNWMTFPVFFGMVTSSYEGIGTIIPIESSMEGNRHNFSKFLHLAVLTLTCILIAFGITGYLQNGDTTEQMINKHIPTSDAVGMAINIFLCVGVMLSFPLQIYPVIELSEIYIFGQGSLCGPKTVKNSYDNDEWEGNSEDKMSLLPKKDAIIPAPVAITISDEVSTWKRNLLRLFVVLFAAGIAVLMRDLFAYVGAFIGAIGSILLAYVLPCLFHLRLCWHKLGYGIRAKDILIIIFGIAASIVSLYTTILEVVNKV